MSYSTAIPFMLAKLKEHLGPWLYRVYYRDTFLFDRTWGGIISANGWLSPGSDYGNGFYNDHHFHYGYYLYAGAVVLRFDRNWEWGPFLMDLARDISNPSTADPYYPITRHKDWYAGHSWAQGLDPTYDGKNQESSSEAVNAYYALQLYGMSLNNDLVKNVGRVLLATELRSIYKYWHTLPNSVYPPIFANNSVVGIVWQAKSDYLTFFGDNTVFIHCIQMLPFIPISEVMLPATWIKYEFPILSNNYTFMLDWDAYVYQAMAIINRTGAWNIIRQCPDNSFGSGNSRTNAYWWVATRPDFNPNQEKR